MSQEDRQRLELLTVKLGWGDRKILDLALEFLLQGNDLGRFVRFARYMAEKEMGRLDAEGEER